MIGPDTPAGEADRLVSLRALGLLDTLPEDRFDRITRLAARIFDVPIALVSLVDSDRQWFKASIGLEVDETSRDHSFCGHAILGPEVMHVSDATEDERFHDNPLVTGDPEIRFYAGCPIAAPDGALVGTVCVIDNRPRELAPGDLQALKDLAAIVEQELAMHRLAIDDDLTGLRNRRGFDLLGTQTLALCRRQRRPAVVVFADVDGLKTTNDVYGHNVGDALLQEFAGAFEESLRDADVVARVGGDEFAAVLSGATSARAVIDRLLRTLDERNLQFGEDRLPLSVALGSAVFDPEAPMQLEVLVARADAAMYEMKRASRRDRPAGVGSIVQSV